MSALPAGLGSSSQARRGRRKKTDNTPLVAEGKVVSKAFNLVAERPMPAMTSLDQSIRVTLGSHTPSFFTTSTSIPTYASAAFILTNFGDYLQYVGLFDQYRFEQIEVWIAPNSVVTNVAIGDFVSAVDIDDAATPAAFSPVLSKQGALSTSGQSSHYHKWRPHVAIAAYSGAFTSFSNEPALWIYSGSPSFQHFGLKLAAQPSAAAQTYSIEVRAVISFRAPGIP